ncbi:MAG: cytochrome c biogenesis protein CcsA [Candidatus Bathyarchaeota archaeon]|nr:MAG: cytochrome c biogenesis protein CcsA [Candidatus Bathyarchaeota archaeon]
MNVMRYRDDVYLAISVLINGMATYFALFIAPAEVEMGELVRIFYFHLPPALVCYLTVAVSMISGVLFLVKNDAMYDAISESAALLGLVYGVVTLVGGAIWANATWGVYWNWDPRETTTLILWIAYIGYFFLRMSVENPERRASVAAAYNVLAFLTMPLSYLSFILWPSLHPRLSEGGGLGLTAPMVQALVLNIVGGVIMYVWLLRKAYEVRIKRDGLAQLISEEVSHAG